MTVLSVQHVLWLIRLTNYYTWISNAVIFKDYLRLLLRLSKGVVVPVDMGLHSDGTVLLHLRSSGPNTWKIKSLSDPKWFPPMCSLLYSMLMLLHFFLIFSPGRVKRSPALVRKAFLIDLPRGCFLSLLLHLTGYCVHFYVNGDC